MFRKKREYLEALGCLIIIFAIPAFLCWPAILRDDLPLNLHSLSQRVPWQDSDLFLKSSPEGAPDDDKELVERYFPWYTFLRQSGMNAELPLWNPYEGFGIPFLALWRTRALSLFSLPFYFWSLGIAFGLSVFTKLSVAGLAAYYAARRFQFSPTFALLVALPYQLCGAFTVVHWHPISDFAAFFPLFLPCLQRLLLGERRVWPYLALLTGMVVLAGDPESLVAMFIFMVVLVIVFGIRTYQHNRILGALIWLVLSIGIGCCLAAMQLVPYGEFLSYGKFEEKANYFSTIGDLASLWISPKYLGDNFLTLKPSLWLPAGLIGFLCLPLWLALRPYAHRIRKRRVEAFLISSVAVLFASFLLSKQLRMLPTLARMDVTHFLIPFPFAAGLLTATTIEEWLHLDAAKCKDVLRRFALLFPILWGCGLTIALVLWLQEGVGLWMFLVSITPLFATTLILLAILFITLLWPRPTFTSLSLCLITAVLLWHVYQPHQQKTPAKAIEETDSIRTIVSRSIRVAGSKQLASWPLSLYGIRQVYSPSGLVLNRTDAFLKQAEINPDLLRLTASNQLFLTKQDIKGRFAPLRPVLNIHHVFPSGIILLNDLEAYPYARIVHSLRQEPFGQSIPIVRPSGPALVEGGTMSFSPREGATAQINTRSNGFTKKYFSVRNSHAGVFVLAEAWYPGWRAFINGTLSPVLPVDIAFIGVEIGGGNHEVIFEFRPESLRIGGYISACALFVVFLGLLFLFRNRNLTGVY